MPPPWGYQPTPPFQLNAVTVGTYPVNRTVIQDADITVLVPMTYLGLIATLTAMRTAFLPDAATYPVGVPLSIVDEVGGATAFPLRVLAYGTQTIAGAASINLSSVGTRFAVNLYTNGSDRWSVFQAGASAPSGPTITQGLYANRPGSGTNVGDTYQAIDSPLKSIWSGAAWNTYLREETAAAPGPSGNWTQVNFGGKVTVSDVGGTIGMDIADTATFNIRGLFKAQPATPYHVEFFIRTVPMHTNTTETGVYFYDGTKLMALDFLSQTSGIDTIRIQKITNVTTDSSTAKSSTLIIAIMWGGGMWLRLGNTGATLTFDYALVRGDWIQYYTEPVGTFITPTQYGFGGMCVTGTGANTLHINCMGVNLTS